MRWAHWRGARSFPATVPAKRDAILCSFRPARQRFRSQYLTIILNCERFRPSRCGVTYHVLAAAFMLHREQGISGDMRFLLVLLVSIIGIGGQPGWAQSSRPVGKVSTWLKAPSAPSLSSSEAFDGWPRFRRSLGFGVLGAAIGGGLGALIGKVDSDVLFCRERYCHDGYSSDESDEISLTPLGIWIGGLVGAIAGGRAPMDGETLFVAIGGSLLGGVFAGAAAAAFSNGRPAWSYAGFAMGISAGAALAVMTRPVMESKGIVHFQEGSWSVGIPSVQVHPGPIAPGRPVRSVVLMTAQF